MYEHFPFPDCRLEQVTRAGPERVELAVRATRPQTCCPTCLTPSNALHSYYQRHPADLPSLGQVICLNLSVRRFYCRNQACPRQTFAESLPELLTPRARRTQRLAMPTSADTVLRLVRGLPLPTTEAPRIVGVDDWALKKGQSYGTILVDLEARRVVDLLPDRTAPALASWLEAHPTIEAVQVADRWHLLYNLRQMLGRWLAGIHGRLEPLPPVAGEAPPRRRTQAYPRTRAEVAATAESRARWLARYQEVRRRFQAGETLLAIGRALGLARSTVRRYAYAEHFPERAVRVPPPSILDPYLSHLEARLAQGCENAMALWRELQGPRV